MTVITWYGGSETSYVESNGAPLARSHMNVYALDAGGSPITALKAKALDGTISDATEVISDDLGFFRFGVVSAGPGLGGVVYLDTGVGYRKAIQPADTGDRLAAAETALAAATTAIAGLIAAPTGLVFSSATWTASTTIAAGTFLTVPSGAVWLVTVGYTSGTTYGSTDTSHATQVTPVPPSGFLTQTAADLRYAPLGAAFKQVTMWTGDLVYTGYDMDVNGCDFIAAGAIHQLDVVMDLPPIGADAIYDFYRLVPGTNAETNIGSVTVTAGTVHGVTTMGSDLAVADGDKVTARVRQVGSTYAGRGAKVRLSLAGRSFPTITTPGVPSGLAFVSSTSTSVTMSWVNGTNSSQTILYIDGKPYRNVGSTTSFTHTGLDPVLDVAGHAYSVQARRYSAVSAVASGTLSAAPNVVVNWLPNAGGDGALDASMVAILKGTAVSGAGAVVSGGRIVVTSTNTTSGGAADRVSLRHERDTTTHTGVTWPFQWRPGNAGWQNEWYVRSGSVDPQAASPTNYWVLQADTSGVKFAGKLGSLLPSSVGGNANGVGSYQLFSDSAYPTNLFTTGTRVAGGKMPWPSGTVPLSTSADVAIYIECLPVSVVDGSQTVNVRYGTSTQFGTRGATASSMPLWFTVVFPANWLTGMVGGRFYSQLLGPAASGGTVNSMQIVDSIPTPLTPAGL